MKSLSTTEVIKLHHSGLAFEKILHQINKENPLNLHIKMLGMVFSRTMEYFMEAETKNNKNLIALVKATNLIKEEWPSTVEFKE